MLNQRFYTYLITLMLAVFVLIGGCASDTRNRVLDDSLRLYSSAIRWGDFIGATKFYSDPSLYSHIDFDKMKSVKVTSYEPFGGELTPDGMNLKQRVVIRYYDTGIGKEKEISDTQTWKYDSEREIWLLLSPMPSLN